jgi:hypothetical protein
MKKITEQMAADNPPSDSPKSEIEEVIQSLRDITREIEKLQDSPPASLETQRTLRKEPN